MASPKSTLVLSALGTLVLAGCPGEPEDPAERIAEARSGYSAELNGYTVDQVPLAGAEPPAIETGADADAEAAVGESDELAEDAETERLAEVPLRQDVILDILVSRRGHDALPGITVDVSQVDAQENEKASWKAYIDTSDLPRGPGAQMVHRLEDVDYEEGDGFFVEVRHPVPAAERGEYREFQEPTEGAG